MLIDLKINEQYPPFHVVEDLFFVSEFLYEIQTTKNFRTGLGPSAHGLNALGLNALGLNFIKMKLKPYLPHCGRGYVSLLFFRVLNQRNFDCRIEKEKLDNLQDLLCVHYNIPPTGARTILIFQKSKLKVFFLSKKTFWHGLGELLFVFLD